MVTDWVLLDENDAKIDFVGWGGISDWGRY